MPDILIHKVTTVKRNNLLVVFLSLIAMLGLIIFIVNFGTDTKANVASPGSSAAAAASAAASIPQRTASSKSLKSSEPVSSRMTELRSSVPSRSTSSSRSIASSGGSEGEKVPSGRYYIKINNILQRPELPTGCEATALTILLNYLGYKVDKCTIADDYLPVTDEPLSLDTHFIGNPHLKSGLGCNAPVIVQTANLYLSNVKSSRQAKLLTKSSPEQLYRYVAKGIPVICWTTIAMLDTRVSATWTAKDTGQKVNFMINEHCTVLAGYDTEKDTVVLNDPWKGIVVYSMKLFEKRYRQMGSQAVILI